jgi:peptidyl-prolyl cis-trans isomerase SurA
MGGNLLILMGRGSTYQTFRNGKTGMKRKIEVIIVMALILSSGLLFGDLVSTVSAGEVEVVDRIVAIVNDDIITLSELNRIYQPEARKVKAAGYSIKEERRRLFRIREVLLNRLINNKLADQEIKKKKITVSKEEVNQTIERFKESKMLSDEDLRAHVADMGLTMEEYREDIADSILKNKLVTYEISSKIVITEEDIKAYYNENPTEYASIKSYHLRNIATRVPENADDLSRSEALNQMETILEKLEQGESIDAILIEYTNAEYPVIGGDLGKVRLNELSETLQIALKDKATGEHTKILAADFGYQIILIQDVSETQGKSLDEAKDDIRRKLYRQKMDEKYVAWVEQMRGKALVKIIK